MTIKKSDFFLNFMMFCLGPTVGRRIGDPYLMRDLAAKSADLMLMNLPYRTLLDKKLFHKPQVKLNFKSLSGLVIELALL
jgi:hypothetical protein